MLSKVQAEKEKENFAVNQLVLRRRIFWCGYMTKNCLSLRRILRQLFAKLSIAILVTRLEGAGQTSYH